MKFIQGVALAILAMGASCSQTKKKPDPQLPSKDVTSMGACSDFDSHLSAGHAGLASYWTCDKKTKLWTFDEKLTKQAADEEAEQEKKRRNLVFALRSRILTDAEMAEVASHGIYLFVGLGQSFYELDKIKEMNESLLQQFRLREARRNAEKCAK